MARKTKISDDLVKSIVKCIKLGLSYRYTCNYVGIDEKTFIRWRKIGEKESRTKDRNSLFSRLFQEVKKAESEAILMRLKNIKDASKENWQAAAWFLERKYHDEWGRKNKHTFEGSVKLETILSALPEELSEEIRGYLAQSISERRD